MKKINKGLLLSIGAGAAGLAPLLSVSCVGEKATNKRDASGYAKYANSAFADKKLQFPESSADAKVKIGVTWSRGKSQWNALSKVADVFNKDGKAKLDRLKELEAKPVDQLTEEEATEKEELTKFKKYFLEVEVVSAGTGGYKAGIDGIRTKISGKNTSELVNLTYNYPPLAAYLASQGMLLNFNDKDPMLKTTLEVFDDRFTSNNQTISNVINAGTWVIPGAISTIVVSVDSSVLSYVLETMEANGATISLKGNDYNILKEAGKGDREAVKTLWGEPIAAEEIRNILGSNYVVDQDTFGIGSKLFDFAYKAQQIFANSKDRRSSVHALGIDDIAGFIESLGYASINGVPSEMITKSIVRTKDGIQNRVADFTPFISTESEIGKNMIKIYQELKKGVGNSSIVIQGDGQYTSVDAVNHKYIFGIGSTAGYFHNFVKPKDLPSIYSFLPEGDGNWSHAIDFSSKASLNTAWAPENATTISFSDGKHSNQIISSTFEMDERNKNGNQYNYFAKDASSDAKITEAISALQEENQKAKPEGFAGGYYAIILPTKTNEKDIEKLKTFAQANPDKMMDLGLFYKGDNTDTSQIFIQVKNLAATDSSHFKFKAASVADTVQEEELFAFGAPTKWTMNDEENIVYLQGPSLIGISTTKKLDDAAKLFVNFLINGKANKDLDDLTPLVSFTQGASYLNVAKGFEEADPNSIKNKFNRIAFEQFKKVVTDSGDSVWNTYTEIPDERADEFRTGLKTAFQNMANSVVNSPDGQTSGTYKTDIIDSVRQSNASLFN